MTLSSAIRDRRRGVRLALAVLLAVSLAVGAYLVWPTRGGNKIVGYFTSAVGLYPGDQIRIVGVPVGRSTRSNRAPKTSRSPCRWIVASRFPRMLARSSCHPILVAARFIQLAPAYTSGPALSDGASIALAQTAVPVEWDEVKNRDGSGQATQSGGRSAAGSAGQGDQPSRRHVQRQRRFIPISLRELSQAAGRLGDSRTDIFGTVKNLQVLVDALSASNEQIVSFAGHVASVSQVLAKSSTHLDNTLAP